MKLLVGPRGEALGVNALGYLPNVSRELGVTLKVVKELSVRRAILWRSPLCGVELGAPREALMPLGLSTT
jgi:hypothetical protein